MKNIEPPIGKYIDSAVSKAVGKTRILFKKDMQHFMAIQREILQDDIKKIAEMVAEKPSRSEVREIVKEEIFIELKPIRAEMQMYREELLDHRTRIGRLESKCF